MYNGQQPIFILKEGTTRTSGKTAQSNNIAAAKAKAKAGSRGAAKKPSASRASGAGRPGILAGGGAAPVAPVGFLGVAPVGTR